MRIRLNLIPRIFKISIFDFLSWEKGTYNFVKKEPPTGLLSLHVEHLLMEWLHYKEEELEKRKNQTQDNTNKISEDNLNDEWNLIKKLEKDLSERDIDIIGSAITNLNSLKNILDLFSDTDDVTYACIISRDGLYHGYESTKFEFPYSVGALAANMWGMINSFADELLKDEILKSIYLKFDKHIVIFHLINESVSLMIIANYGVDIEYIKWLTLKTKENILALLGN